MFRGKNVSRLGPDRENRENRENRETFPAYSIPFLRFDKLYLLLM